MHRLELCSAFIEDGDALGGAFDFLGVHSCRQVPVELLEIPVADGAFGDSVAEFRIVPEYHQVDELVLERRELFAQGLYVPVILVMGIFHREFLFATIQDYHPLLIVGAPDD